MATVQLDGTQIKDWPSFHRICRVAFGFPDFYGNNMDAWVDCMSYLRDDDGMTRFKLQENEILTITVSNAAALRTTAPDILDDLQFCIEAINDRYTDYGEKAALTLKLA